MSGQITTAIGISPSMGIAIQGALSNWILATGFWRDIGEWIDSEIWKD